MKKLLFFTSIFCALHLSGQQIDYSMKCFQSAMNELNMNDLVAADSLFSLSIYLKPSAEAYMNRAKIRYYFQDMIGYCSDVYNASKMGDSQATQLYERRCSMYDPDVKAINTTVKPAQLPEFDSFYGKLTDYIAEYLIYPAEAKYSNIKGIVTVSFIVNAEGKPESVFVLKGIGYGCDEEAVRLVSSMPLWIPAKATDSDGNTVNIPWKTEINVQFK
jgi:TonB family protein